MRGSEEEFTDLGQRSEALLLDVPNQLILGKLQTLADAELGHVDPGQEYAVVDLSTLQGRLVQLLLRAAGDRRDGLLWYSLHH